MGLRAPALALSTQFASFVALKSLGATQTQAIMVSVAMPVSNLLAILWPGMMARRSRVMFAFWSDLAALLCLIPMALVTSPVYFIAFVFLSVVLRSPSITALAGIIRDNYEPESRGRTLGIINSAMLGTMALSGFIFGRILDGDLTAYRYLFPLSALLGVVAIMGVRRIPEQDPSERHYRRYPSVFDLFRIFRSDRDYLHYQISFFFFGFAVWMFNSLLPLYLAETLQVNYNKGALALVVLTFGIPVITGPLWGMVIDRFNLLLVRGVLNLIWSMCPLIIFLFNSIEAVLIGQAIVGFVTGGGKLIWTLGVNVFAAKDDVPSYMSVHQTLTGVRGILAPIIGLALARFFGTAEVLNYRFVFAICWIIMIIAGVYMLWESQVMKKRGRATVAAVAERKAIPAGK